MRGVLDAYNFGAARGGDRADLAVDERVVTHVVTTRARPRPTTSSTCRPHSWVNVSTTQFARANPTEGLANRCRRRDARRASSGSRSPRRPCSRTSTPRPRRSAAANLGVKVALDDFGVGHSSLTLLRSLPIDTVKIDRSFVRGHYDRGCAYAAIVESIVGLAVKLGIEVVAEESRRPNRPGLLR